MKATISISGQDYNVDLSQPMDISIPLHEKGPRAYHAPAFQAEPVKAGDFIGSVKEGGPVNFVDIKLNPHGNGTHTECIGHITPDGQTINNCLKRFLFLSKVITIEPIEKDGDKIITAEQIGAVDPDQGIEALVIRTLPNGADKLSQDYSGTNPPYFEIECMKRIVEMGIEHLLIDLPSVDREEDGGQVLCHKIFWKYPDRPRVQATITEMIFIPDGISDGNYLLDLMISSMELDASPSKPILYNI
ncbi:MAG: cyclase family protein [Bacteroidetes bacterium]|nr:cyclase family protein [Bacteroidota bacterium]